MGLGSALLRLGGVWIQNVGGVKWLIALYYGKIINMLYVIIKIIYIIYIL